MMLKKWLYYINDKNSKVYRINLDTEVIEKIIYYSVDDEVFANYKNYIVYENKEDSRIYRIYLDGRGRKQISKSEAYSSDYKKGYIYYKNSRNHISKVNVENTEEN